MATTKKKKYVKFTSPPGVFAWPKLNRPDYGNDKYPKKAGEYSVKLIVEAADPEVAAFVEKLQPYMDAAIKSGKAGFKGLKVEARKKLKDITINHFFSTIYDEETEEPTGEIAFKMAMNASGEYKHGSRTGEKWSRKPALYDTKGVPMLKGCPDIWGGTVGKVAFSMDPEGYFIEGTAACGLKLQLEAVQVIDLVSEGMRSASDYGFGEEEGYLHDDNTFAKDEDDTAEDQEGSGDDEGDDEGDF